MSEIVESLDLTVAGSKSADADLNDTLDRVVGIIRRRRWWILLSACGIALATATALSFIPNRYTSEATVLVIQQQVPERYVTPTTTTDISQALQGMTQEVLARTRLMSIIEELGLYPRLKSRVAPEALLEMMRKDIGIQPLENNPERRSVNAFKISYTSESPQLAQEVASRLTALFIQENLKTREHQATVTTNFLEDQLDAAKKQLTQQEERLRAFKMQHLGELPEQQQGNVQILSSLTSQLDNTMAALSRAEQQRVYLQSLLNGYRRIATRSGPATSSLVASAGVRPGETIRDRLTRLQAEKRELLSRYTPGHPDVRQKEQEIRETQAQLAQLNLTEQPPAEAAAPSSAQPEGTEEDTAIAQVRSQLEANRVEIANLSKDAGQLKESITGYRGRLNATPIREQQLAGMLRDYDLLKKNYSDLLGKRLESQLSADLEKHQEGQQFRLVDPPSLPTVASSPKRVKISLGGAIAGIALGLALAFLRDMFDRSFRTEKELAQQIKVPMIFALPLALTPGEVRGRRWRVATEWLAGSVMVLAVLVVEFYVYRRG